jgi:glycosyltransferase involved in cell wall biosynthesis
MQVWLLNHYAQEPGGAGGTRHYSLAKHLLKFGWSTSIIAASVELQSGRQRLSGRRKWELAKSGGIPFLWVRTPQYSGNGLGRLWNMLVYSARVLLPSVTCKLPRPDVIVGSSVHPFAAWSAAILARRFNVPFIFEVRDLWPQTLIDFGRLTGRSLTARLLRFLERWLYRRADRIIVLMPRAVDYIAPLGIDPEKVVWVPNGIDAREFPDPGAKLETNGPFTLMYFGSHGQANGLGVLIRAMELVQEREVNQKIRLRMIGDGPLKPMLQEMAVAAGLDGTSVVFEDSVPKENIPNIASQADAFVISVLDVPGLYQYGISMNKLFEYLAGRRPVVIASGAVNNPVSDAGCGLTVQPGDPEALANAILSLANMSLEQRNLLGSKGRRHVERVYEYGELASRLAELLDDCVTTRGV